MSANSPRVLVVMMQKDEAEALMAWLSHYGGLFGTRNLTIYDNGSTDPHTLAILDHAGRLGVGIVHGYDQPHDFHDKGYHFANLIRSWDAEREYDFALPVDCDELLAVFEDDRIDTSREAILRELGCYLGSERALRMDMSLFNVPGQSGWFSPDRSFHKGMVASRTLREIDNGQHDPQTIAGGHVTTRLTYLHNHNLPYRRYLERVRLKLDPAYAHITDRKALKRLADDPATPGNHLLRALLRPEADYERQYDHTLRVRVRGGGFWGPDVELADARGLIRWDAETYLKMHPDVARHEQGPLHHFLRFGWGEGRDVERLRVV